MSLRINHNIAAMNSHRNLQANDAKLGKSLEKLSSGYKINRAADGPAALVISEQMRAQIAGLDQAVQNSESAVSMVQTAEASLTEVNNLLTNIRQLSIHAANEGVNDDVMLAADQQEITNSLASIDRISKDTQFGKIKLLDGTRGVNGVTTGKGVNFIGANTATKASEPEGYDVVVSQNATKTAIRGTVPLTKEALVEGETLKIIADGKSTTYTTTDLDSPETAIQNLQSAVDKTGLNVDVTLDDNGYVTVSSKDFGSHLETDFQVSSSSGGVLSSEGGEFSSAIKGKDVIGTINGESANGSGQHLKGVTGASNVEDLEIEYDGNADLRERNINGNLIGENGGTLVKDQGGNVYEVIGEDEKTKVAKVEQNGEIVVMGKESFIYTNTTEIPDEEEFMGEYASLKDSGALEKE